jgi:hypothetical protein
MGAYTPPDNVVDPALYLRIKNKIHDQLKKKNVRWNAYSSGKLVREYKKAFAKKNRHNRRSPYKPTRSPRGSSPSLSRWYKEEWIDACKYIAGKHAPCGRAHSSAKHLTYCRPLHRVSSSTPRTVSELTRAEIKRECKRKRKRRGGRTSARPVKLCSKVAGTYKRSVPHRTETAQACRRGRDGKVFSLPRKHSRNECKQMRGGFTKRASCAPFR